MNRPSIDLVKKMFQYNFETGVITRIVGRVDFLGPVGITKEVGIENYKVLKSHLAWALHYGYWPTLLIDHRDGDQQNLKIDNLREATHQQNQFNKIGFGKYPKGVVFKADAKRSKPWSARIRINGKKVPLGSYATMEEAAAAYKTVADKYQGEFSLDNSLTRR